MPPDLRTPPCRTLPAKWRGRELFPGSSDNNTPPRRDAMPTVRYGAYCRKVRHRTHCLGTRRRCQRERDEKVGTTFQRRTNKQTNQPTNQPHIVNDPIPSHVQEYTAATPTPTATRFQYRYINIYMHTYIV
mmetsp:Transcript_5399/g.12628  ORF Transcript_5399/g.12628 Transcript_5399/m.12628 type:complete len:131 (-) Transcript_5399:42-434(-)